MECHGGLACWPHCEPDSEGLVCFLLFQIFALSLNFMVHGFDGRESDMGAKAGLPHVVPVNVRPAETSFEKVA